MDEFYYVIKLPNGNYWSASHADAHGGSAGVAYLKQATPFWSIAQMAARDYGVPKDARWVKVTLMQQDAGPIW